MSNPLWPDPAASFKLFGSGEAPSTMPPPVLPFTQGLAGGMDLVKKFWGNLPGGTALPGFLVPTVDVAELDKRLSDLRAAESWVEMNLNMLRATIQGLEVQRNTIAAIHSLSAMAEGAMAGAPVPTDVPTNGLPAGWPMTPSAAVPQATTAEAPVESAAPPTAAAADATTGVDPLVDLATNNWLGLMQQQFMKVAQAAIAPAVPDASPKAAPKRAARSKATSTAGKAKRPSPAAR